MAHAKSRVANVVGVLAASVLVAGNSPADAQRDDGTRYRVVELRSLGGSSSQGSSIDARGTVAGLSAQSGDATVHATVWRGDRLTDLQTLGGPNSAVLWPMKSTRLVVGVSETASTNPLGEDWSCSAFFPGDATHHVCLGFVWSGGHLRPLQTLGGYNGFASSVNQRGQVVGWAENRVVDPTCVAPQVLQFRAVRWAAHSYRPRELRPLPGDTVSAATAINDRGAAVGISGICSHAVGGLSAAHAVRWDAAGRPADLGTIGGVAWNTPTVIDGRGQITGFANVPGGATPTSFHTHAFLWTQRHGMRDLGTLPGDEISEGLGMNDRGQIVGISCQAHFVACRAFVWRDGVMRDLNELAAGAPHHLLSANDINESGVITGQTLDPSTGVLAAFTASTDGRDDGTS